MTKLIPTLVLVAIAMGNLLLNGAEMIEPDTDRAEGARACCEEPPDCWPGDPCWDC